MDLTKKIKKQGYDPFKKLAIYNFVMYTLLVIGIRLIFYIGRTKGILTGEFPWGTLFIIYLILCVRALWIVLFSLFERGLSAYEKRIVRIVRMDTDGLFGDYKNSNQEIKKCYPKEIEPERIKLVCVDLKGKKINLRIIASKKKITKIQKELLIQKENVSVIYGKFTKIAFIFESQEYKNMIKYNSIKMLNNML